MQNLEIYNALLDKLHEKEKFYLSIIIVLIINIIASIANFGLQFYLKNKEKSFYRIKSQEDKRVVIYETLFRYLDDLTYYDGKTDNEIFLKRIQDINSYVSRNNLYIEKDIKKITTEISDYHKSVLGDSRKKNYATEINYAQKFINSFNK